MQNSSTHRSTKKAPGVRNLPANLEQIIPESMFYTHLQRLENRMDMMLMNKRLDIQEALSRPMKESKILRIFTSNTFSNNNGDEDENDVSSWTLRIDGRLLNVKILTLLFYN